MSQVVIGLCYASDQDVTVIQVYKIVIDVTEEFRQIIYIFVKC